MNRRNFLGMVVAAPLVPLLQVEAPRPRDVVITAGTPRTILYGNPPDYYYAWQRVEAMSRIQISRGHRVTRLSKILIDDKEFDLVSRVEWADE